MLVMRGRGGGNLFPGQSLLLLGYRQCLRHRRRHIGGSPPSRSLSQHGVGGRNITDAHFWDVFGEHFGTVVGGAQAALETLHTISGLSWWGTIMVTSLALRLVTLPVRLTGLLHQSRARAATLDLSYQLPAIRERVARHLATESSRPSLPSSSSVLGGEGEQQRGGARRGAAAAAAAAGKSRHQGRALAKYELTRAWLEAMRARGTHPLRSLLPVLLHLPLFFILTATLRKMSAYPWPFSPPALNELAVEGWETGGIVFFTDLGTPSSWLTLLVFTSGVGTIESIFYGGRSSPSSNSKNSSSHAQPPNTTAADPSIRRLRLWRWALHGANVISVYLLSLLPAAINLFLLTNNLLVMGEGHLLRSRLIRAWVERQVSTERTLNASKGSSKVRK